MTSSQVEALKTLKTELKGSAYERGEDGYAAELEGFNSLSPLNPDLVVSVENEADVQAAMRYANAIDAHVSIMATGHGSYRAIDSGVMIRTHRLDHITVDTERQQFTIGAGGRWMNILPELAKHGLGAVTGSSPSVGAVGLILGGGVGPLSRTLGWSADRLISCRLVTASGEVITVSSTEHEDLYWALRGGKVGFGVVTEMTLEAVPLREVYGGGLFFEESQIETVFRAWLPWARSLPDSANTSIGITRLPEDVPAPLGGKTVAHVRYAYVDLEADSESLAAAGADVLAPMRELGPALVDGVDLLPADRIGEIHAEPLERLPIWERGEFLDEIDDGYIDRVLKIAGEGTNAPFANVETRMFGGATMRDPEHPNSIGGRNAPFALLVIGVDIPGVTSDALATVGPELFDAVESYHYPELNYNWGGHPTGERWDRLWSKETATRLEEIRAQYDPQGRFAFSHEA